MVIQLPAKRLANYLWQPGPYMYFYSGAFGGTHAEIMQYINYVSNIHPKLVVFEVQWRDPSYYKYTSSIEDINKIYVHFEGEKKYEINNPTKQQIDFLFVKCIQFHNIKIEKQIKNIGSRTKRIIKDNTYSQEAIKTQKEIDLETKLLFKNQRKIIKHKIYSPIYKTIIETQDIQNSLSLANQTNYNVKNIAPKYAPGDILNNYYINKNPVLQHIVLFPTNVVYNSNISDLNENNVCYKNINQTEEKQLLSVEKRDKRKNFNTKNKLENKSKYLSLKATNYNSEDSTPLSYLSSNKKNPPLNLRKLLVKKKLNFDEYPGLYPTKNFQSNLSQLKKKKTIPNILRKRKEISSKGKNSFIDFDIDKQCENDLSKNASEN